MRSARLCAWLRWFGLSASLVVVSVAHADSPASRDALLARQQMHANSERGFAYLSRVVADGSSEPATIGMRVVSQFAIDGDGTENAWSNVYPIDVNGDGVFEIAQLSGTRLLRVFRQNGTKLWELRNPSGRMHRSAVHRDTAVVGDFNGDGLQEIVSCWRDAAGKKQLVMRSGLTGAVIRTRLLADDPVSSECQMAAFHVVGRSTPIILVSRIVRSAGDTCTRRYTDEWTVTLALDESFSPLWQIPTCSAGHYVWPLDENRDGIAEALFVGKYLIEPNGHRRCTLPTWGADHVDGLVIADLDPALPGDELVAVGNTGLRTARAATCTGLSQVPRSVVVNPQHLHAAVLKPGSAPVVVVRSRPSEPVPRVYVVDSRGVVHSSYIDTDPLLHAPTSSGNLDGALAAEDLIARFGRVVDAAGKVRLDVGWYWGLQTLTAAERVLPDQDQWTSAPIVLDLNGDNVDEVLTWGRHAMVIGTPVVGSTH